MTVYRNRRAGTVKMRTTRAMANTAKRYGATPATLERRVVLECAALAGSVAILLGVVVPRGGDAAAHLYRTMLVEHGALVWDNLWFAGQYPLASYSLFYYLPAAVFGNTLLAAIAVVVSAVLFAMIVLRVWGPVARLPALAFALLAGGQFFTGDYPYTFGFAALLATLAALQRRRTVVGLVSAALTLVCSPLAFFFLCLTLAALFFRSHRPRWREMKIGAAIVALAGIEVVALAVFPSPHLLYPFTMWRFVLGLPVGILGLALSLRSRSARPLTSLFAVWIVATTIGYFVPSPLGHNLLRPETLVFPMVLLAARLAKFRPRWLALAAVGSAFAANVGPYSTTALARVVDKSASAAFWAPLLSYVAHHGSADYRLEVVPTINHWEAYYVPNAGFAIARGWYQQLDTGDNPALYRHPLQPAVYRAWLRSVGVRYVVLAHTDPAGEATSERSLLLSGKSGLRRVFSAKDGQIYELPHATPILTGTAPAAVRKLGETTITGWTARRGSYLLRIHYNSYWRLENGSVCLRRSRTGMTIIDAQHGGTFSLRADENAFAIVSGILDLGGAKSLACRS